MKIVRNLEFAKPLPELVLTIGNFDGVHLGHLEIISRITKIAKEKNLATAILTFEPHPINFLRPEKARDFRICSLSQKLKIFAAAKIDYAIILPFNQKFSEISATDFVSEILIKRLNTKHLVVGYDFTFGKNREGNFKTLEGFNFDLSEIAPVKNSDLTCSSTIIRKLISEGKIAEANVFLGHNFTISGLVNEGRKLARSLGFPTANLISKPQIIKPKFGVYRSQIFVPYLNKKFSAVTNFGVKPTIGGNLSPLFESHIPNFSDDLYGKKIVVELLDFIREEKKFSSLDELKKQIAMDVDFVMTTTEIKLVI